MARRKASFWVTDCETDPFHNCTDQQCKKCENPGPNSQGRIPQPFIWGLYCGASDEYYEFPTFRELCEFVRSKKITVYAHNGGKFDYHYGRDEINADEPIMVINGRLAKFKIGECEFRDSVNILPIRLKEFQKTEIDYAKLEPDVRHLHMREIKLYLKSDCVNLWILIDAYRKEFGKGLTQAGASLKVWSKRSGLEIPRQTPAQHARYKRYYYGGRVECFRTGVHEEAYSTADMNSAYPSAMRNQKHPYATSAAYDDEMPPEPQLSQCLISLVAISDGAFPFRNEETNELSFPRDDVPRQYHITGHELLAAFEYDAVKVIAVNEVHNFGVGIDFQEYIDHFYGIRKRAKESGDKAQEIFGKFFMNSCYGKLGACPASYEWIDDPEHPGQKILKLIEVNYKEYLIGTSDSVIDWENEGFARYKAWGERFLMCRDIPEERHTFYNVATAASITGYQRAQLFRALRSCGGLIYCDTDSVTAHDVSRLKMGTGLGEWKLEMTGDRYAVAGKKLYAMRSSDPNDKEGYAFDSVQEKSGPWKRACKGVNLSPEDICKVARGEKIVYRPQVPTYSITRPQPRFINRDVIATY